MVRNEHEPLPLDEVPLERLESEITELAAHINAATCRWLLLVAEFDRRRGWGDWECRSCAHWLNWKCGIDLGAARERVRVARALGALPEITASFAAGQLSYSKVRAITRPATPDTEAALVEMARQGTAAHLERIVRAYRKAQRVDEMDGADRIYEDRSLRWHHEDDGTFVLRPGSPPSRGRWSARHWNGPEKPTTTFPRKRPRSGAPTLSATPTLWWRWPSRSWPRSTPPATAATPTW